MSDRELYGGMQRELLEWWREQVRGVDVETLREKSLLAVKTFKTIKQVIWQSARVLDEEGNEIPQEERELDVKLLLGLMEEIQLMFDLHRARMTAGIT